MLFQVALVSWTESVGLTLVSRDLNEMQLRSPCGDTLTFKVLQIFPFTSETKRMGIIVKVILNVKVLLESFQIMTVAYEGSIIFSFQPVF